MRLQKKGALFLLFATGLYWSQSQAILSMVYDPYDVFQNTITAKNSVESLINQAKQLKCDADNLTKLSKGHFENINAVLNQLGSICSQGNSLSYGLNNIDKIFGNKFPGMQPSMNFNQDFSKWSGTAYDTLKQSLLSMSLQGQLFNKENQAIQALQILSENANGNLSAQQTAHRIALEGISQLQKLRQLLLTQASSQDTYMAYQLQKEQSQQAALHEWIKNSQVTFRKYQGKSGFGVNELPMSP